MKAWIKDYKWLESQIIAQGGTANELEKESWLDLKSKYPDIDWNCTDKPLPPLSEDDLLFFETEWGARLPESYRQFLMQHNGGISEPRWFLVPDIEQSDFPWLADCYFMGLDRFDPESIDMFNAYSRSQSLHDDGVPGHLLCIAEGQGGDYYLIAISGENKGCIYFWVHDENYRDDDGNFQVEELSLITDDFDKFINSACTEEDYLKALQTEE